MLNARMGIDIDLYEFEIDLNECKHFLYIAAYNP